MCLRYTHFESPSHHIWDIFMAVLLFNVSRCAQRVSPIGVKNKRRKYLKNTKTHTHTYSGGDCVYIYANILNCAQQFSRVWFIFTRVCMYVQFTSDLACSLHGIFVHPFYCGDVTPLNFTGTRIDMVTHCHRTITIIHVNMVP